MGQVNPRVFIHGLNNITGLVGTGLQNSPGYVALMGVSRKPHHCATRIRAPVWGKESGKRGNNIDPPVVFGSAGQVLHLRGLGNHPQVVPQPLNQGTCNGDRPFQGINRILAPPLIGQGSNQPML